MTSVVVTVPKVLWQAWIAEGDIPGEEAQYESHFWVSRPLPQIEPGERVYIVAHGRLRGYAPLVRTEQRCQLYPERACLIREGGAVAVTIPETICGFRGWRYRFWDQADEVAFPEWRTDGVASQKSVRPAPRYVLTCMGCTTRLDPANPRGRCSCDMEVKP